MTLSWNAICFCLFLTIFPIKQSNEKGVGVSFLFICATQGLLLLQTQTEKSQRENVCSFCAFEPQPKVSVSQQQTAGRGKMAEIATIQKCIGTLYS